MINRLRRWLLSWAICSILLHAGRARAQGAAVNQAKGTGDGRQWGAQLMADGGDELVFIRSMRLRSSISRITAIKRRSPLVADLRDGQLDGEGFAVFTPGSELDVPAKHLLDAGFPGNG